MPQAQSWSDITGPLKALTEAAAAMPAPPTPDDEYSHKRNDLNRTIEGLNEQVNGRVQMEEMNDA